MVNIRNYKSDNGTRCNIANLAFRVAGIALALSPVVAAVPVEINPTTSTITAYAPCNAYEHNHAGEPGVVNPDYPDCDELKPGDAPIWAPTTPPLVNDGLPGAR